MANETTSTSQATLVATEVLMQGAIEAHRPSLVVMNQLHWDDISDSGSGTVKYPVYSDLGSASGGTEGTDLATNTELTMASAISVSPTEGAIFKAVITETVVKRRLGGMPYPSVIDIFQSQDVGMLSTLLAPDIQRGTITMLNKVETDCVALLDDPADTAGGGAAVDLRILDAVQAIFELRINQPLRPPSDWKFILTPHQVHELNLEALSTGGGMGGSLWTSAANYQLMNRPGDELLTSGFRGRFLDYPVYEYDHELRLEAGGAAKGALLAGGRPDQSPRDPALGGKVGYGVLVWEAPIQFRFQYDVSLRAMEIVGSCRYAVSELVDLNGIEITSDDY